MAQPKTSKNSTEKISAEATAYRGRTSGYLFKIIFNEITGWLNYDSVAEDIAENLQEGIEDALGTRSSGSLTLQVTLSKKPDTELRSGKTFLSLSDVKITDYKIW